MSTTLRAVRGFVVIKNKDDATEIEGMQVEVEDTNVAGVPIKNVVIQTAAPAPLTTPPGPDPAFAIPSHGLTLTLQGDVGGVRSTYTVDNSDPWIVDTSSPTQAHLAGSLQAEPTDSSGRLLPVSINTDVLANAASPRETECATQSPVQRLFGFEDARSWSSKDASLFLVTTPTVQGCGALGVKGQGYFRIDGARFSTSEVTVDSALSVDLFVPAPQPNPFWLGAIQMYLSCPSADLNNQYIAQVDLTGRPQGNYSTLRFPLPGFVKDKLRNPVKDCSVSLAMNINPTSGAWILDNLRFSP
jgi:hypothetical protein